MSSLDERKTMVAPRRPRARASGKTGPEGPELWARRESDGSYVIGFTLETQQRLGPVSYFRGPQAGRRYASQEAALSLESEKCVRQLSLPAEGTVLETNSDLEGDPSAINQDPYGKGWVCRVRPARPRALEDATEYPPRIVR